MARHCRPQWGQHGGAAKDANRLAVMARRIAGRLGCGGGPAGRVIFFPPARVLEPQVLQVGVCDAGHQRVAVQASPGAALKIAETHLLLELLVRLLAHPPRLDRRG